MPGEGDRFLRHAFHEAAVAGDDIGVMVHDIVAKTGGKMRFGERHADGVGEALAERTGGRLHRRSVAVFGMAGGLRTELAEVFQLFKGHALVAEEETERVEQHRAVAGGEHEPVAVRPVGRGGVEFQVFGEQRRRCVGHAHRHARMAGFRVFNPVHRQSADGVRHLGKISPLIVMRLRAGAGHAGNPHLSRKA